MAVSRTHCQFTYLRELVEEQQRDMVIEHRPVANRRSPAELAEEIQPELSQPAPRHAWIDVARALKVERGPAEATVEAEAFCEAPHAPAAVRGVVDAIAAARAAQRSI